ncbi:dimethylargininase [Rarobacter incanus]|uniref:Dimethylargininase n=2 Tax=Rarobacter incanus TaxID=153494 RepID=A0A542SPD7_9MICO|nr:dimethylargininase [Rarobacter incanus]
MGELTHFSRVAVDADLALAQWRGYVDALAAAGFSPLEVASADNQPDGVFVEDTVVMLGATAVISLPGAASRRGEIDTMARTVSELGVDVQRIVSPGTLEGGDVLKVGSTVYVGRSSRTNDAGIAQLEAIAARLGYRVVAVPVTKTLHLKSQVTALPDGTVIGYEPLVDSAAVFPKFLPVPEPEGVAVVVLDESTVLMSAAAPRTAELLRERGLAVIAVPITEFEKMEGCVTCLSVRVR